jgi:SAM-dependent methyltransferase
MVISDQQKSPVAMAELRDLFERQPANVQAEISPDDGMYVEGHKGHYFSVGQSALQGIKLAMLAAGKDDVRDLLDMGCGYGRVLRTLKAAFPQARLTASDLLPDAVDFCAKAFGATPAYSKERPDQIRMIGTFDLIWCGTMLTNLNSDRWKGFFDLFHSLLRPGGILVFTTHGRLVADRLRKRSDTYGLQEDVARTLLEDYDRLGFGYGDYPREVLQLAHIESDYGISVSSPPWVCSRLGEWPDLRLLTYTERGWDDHQDLIACVRVAGPSGDA